MILISVFSLSFISCNKKVTEDEAIKLVKEFLTESYELNEIYYGKGIDYEKNEDGVYDNIYSPVLKNQPYTTEAILRAKTEDVFSASLASSILGYHFNLTQGIAGGLSREPGM